MSQNDTLPQDTLPEDKLSAPQESGDRDYHYADAEELADNGAAELDEAGQPEGIAVDQPATLFRMLVEHRLIRGSSRRLSKAIKRRWTRFWTHVDKAAAIPAIRLLGKKTPIDKDTIVFITTRGDYDCNPKWICEEILRRGLPYRLVWVARTLPSQDYPPQLTLVKRDSFEFQQEAARAHVIIDNSISLAYMLYKKKPGQVLIETWHGAIGIKKFSRDTNNDKRWIQRADQESSQTDYCISNSVFETDLFRDTFWSGSEILQYGHARNDILFGHDPERLRQIRENIYSMYRLDPDTHICLYAPTFRDDKDLSPYQIPYRRLLEALQTRFGGKWVIFTRYHFKVNKKLSKLPLPAYVVNVGDYPDIQELLTCTDVGITDYSSWICEYMLTGRPGFLFATDAASFATNERALFYPLSSMPFPLAETSDQLIENILHFDQEAFTPACRAFLEKYGCIDDGHAAERIVDKLQEIMAAPID